VGLIINWNTNDLVECRRKNKVMKLKERERSGNEEKVLTFYPARARSARARRACALRALGLLLADGTPTGGRGEDFLSRQPDFFTETAVTPERKVEKSFSRWEINRHVEG